MTKAEWLREKEYWLRQCARDALQRNEELGGGIEFFDGVASAFRWAAAELAEEAAKLEAEEVGDE
jgi:hypothetical protein